MYLNPGISKYAFIKDTPYRFKSEDIFKSVDILFILSFPNTS